MPLFSFLKFFKQKQIPKSDPGSHIIDPVFDDIRVKLAELSRKDPGYTIFGSSTHRYKRRPKLPETEIKTFEQRYGIQLPADYRGFLMHLSNGGASPFYGIEKLQDSIYFSLDYKNEEVNDPSQEFPFTEAWNLSDGGIYPDQYFGNKERISFLEWYELWLDKSLEELSK